MNENILIRNIPIEMLEGKTILLTGATGLVGTHFLYAFRDIYNAGININVIALGRSSPPEHLVQLFEMSFIKYFTLNLTSEFLHPYFKNIDIIIHAASYGQPGQFIKYATETISLNTSVTIDLFKRMANNGKFLFISSSEVCSGLYDMPIAEDRIGITTPYHPRACYIEAKRCGEAIVNIFRETGIDAKSVRLCLAYGEGTRRNDQRVLNDLIRKAILDKEIKLMDAGQAIRTYCYVGDAVNMMLKILLEGEHPVYNVGGILSLNIAALASLIGKLTGTPIVLQFGHKPLKGAPDMVNMSIQRYIDEFGEREFVSMEEGLRRTIEYQKILYVDSIK
jgi:nucleoside-diphosphate-sugar epimerase